LSTPTIPRALYERTTRRRAQIQALTTDKSSIETTHNTDESDRHRALDLPIVVQDNSEKQIANRPAKRLETTHDIVAQSQKSALASSVAGDTDVSLENVLMNHTAMILRNARGKVVRQPVKYKKGAKTDRTDDIGIKTTMDGRYYTKVSPTKSMVRVAHAAPLLSEMHSRSIANSAYVQNNIKYTEETVRVMADEVHDMNGKTASLLASRSHPAPPTNIRTTALEPRRRPKRVIDLGPEPDYNAQS
jgi:hypothetical protein